MTMYIDGFVLPVPRNQLDTYKEVAERVGEVWREHGAIDYSEYVIDDSNLEGTRSFTDAANAREDEAVIFGWVSFESRDARDLANRRVAADPRMTELIHPLTRAPRPIFDAERMLYGGFRALVESTSPGAE